MGRLSTLIRVKFGISFTYISVRVIRILLQYVPGLEFHCAVPFDRVDAYKGKDIARKLLLCFQEQDDESIFELSIDCQAGMAPDASFKLSG